jgi:chorismate mutase
MNPALELRALRGATTASANTSEAIAEAVSELIETLVRDNALKGSQLLSVTCSVTVATDLNSPFVSLWAQPISSCSFRNVSVNIVPSFRTAQTTLNGSSAQHQSEI